MPLVRQGSAWFKRIAKPIRHWHVAVLLAGLAVGLANCGGGGDSTAPPPAPPTSVTDTSGDFAITVRTDSSTQITVTWEDPTAKYALQPISKSTTVYRDGAAIASGYGASYTDSGLQPSQAYCYKVVVTAVYQALWTTYTMGWSSGTACISTLYGLRVVSSSPGAGDVSIPLDSPITVTFNGAIDPASVSPTSFQVSDGSGDLEGSLTVDGNTIRFRPSAGLEWGKTYTVTVGTGVRDTAGYALSAPYRWTFTERMSTACLAGVWGSSPADVFVVANDGAVLRFDGSAWSAIRAADGLALSAVWGNAANNVYAVGNGKILRYNGANWTEAWSGSASLKAIWGSAADNVFAVGTGGTILHFDGSAWSTMSSGTTTVLASVWGAAPNDVFATGVGGTILHYDGANWTPMESGVVSDLFAVGGLAADDVVAAGRSVEDPNVLYYDGSVWQPSPYRLSDVTALWGVEGGSMYATVERSVLMRMPASPSGYYWTPLYSGNEISPVLLSIWGTSANNLYATGCGGTVLRYDGTSWTQALP